MGNTADLAMAQKTIIDTLHKESKSQRVITERVAVYRVLYQSILNAKLTEKKKLGREMCWKITGLLLSGPKIKVNFSFHLEITVWRKTRDA